MIKTNLSPIAVKRGPEGVECASALADQGGRLPVLLLEDLLVVAQLAFLHLLPSLHPHQLYQHLEPRQP